MEEVAVLRVLEGVAFGRGLGKSVKAPDELARISDWLLHGF